jgi:hypothetical protein
MRVQHLRAGRAWPLCKDKVGRFEYAHPQHPEQVTCKACLRKMAAASKKKVVTPVVHLVKTFVALKGKTFCGIYSENITAYPDKATCENCKKNEAI